MEAGFQNKITSLSGKSPDATCSLHFEPYKWWYSTLKTDIMNRNTLPEMEDRTMTFGEKLSRLRRTNNYTQEQLAEILGVSRQAISKWESGDSLR